MEKNDIEHASEIRSITSDGGNVYTTDGESLIVWDPKGMALARYERPSFTTPVSNISAAGGIVYGDCEGAPGRNPEYTVFWQVDMDYKASGIESGTNNSAPFPGGVLTAEYGGPVLDWRMPDDSPRETFGGGRSVRALEANETWAFTSSGSSFYRYSMADKKETAVREADPIKSLLIAENYLLSWSQYGPFRVWDMETLKVVREIEFPQELANDDIFRVQSHGNSLAIFYPDPMALFLFDLETGKQRASFSREDSTPISEIWHFNEDGLWFAKGARLWLITQEEFEAYQDTQPFEYATAQRELLKACDKGDMSAAKAALDAGADINRSSVGGSPLWRVVSRGKLKDVKWMIAQGASVKALDRSGQTIVNTPALKLKRGILKALLDAGAPPSGTATSPYVSLRTNIRFGGLSPKEQEMAKKLMAMLAAAKERGEGSP